MSRIERQRPIGAVPSQYNDNEYNASEEKTNVVNSIPPKILYRNNLSRLHSYKIIRHSYKLKNAKQIFLNDLGILLKEYDTNEFQFDTELLREIINIAHSYFIYGSSTERLLLIDKCVTTLMLPYFNDINVLKMTITMVLPSVKKSNIIRRSCSKLIKKNKKSKNAKL
jgi:hypothetical protein